MSYDTLPEPGQYDLAEFIPPWQGLPFRHIRKPPQKLTLADEELWLSSPRMRNLYEVSSHGRVRTVARMGTMAHGNQWVTSEGRTAKRPIPARILRLPKGARYPHVNFEGKTLKVHWLVAEAFLGKTPPGQVIRHLDDDRQHNAPANLAFGSYVQNSLDAYANGRMQRGRNRLGGPDLPPEHAAAIRALAGPILISELARVFGRSRGSITAIRNGTTFKYVAPLSFDEALAVFNAEAGKAKP